MKKKIAIGLITFSLIFLAGGIYIVRTIQTATSKLDSLVTLHKVEILREHLLINIRRVQSDINLKNTRYAKNIDTAIENVRNMEKTANACFECHHSGEMMKRLLGLRNDIERYQDAISRALTLRANTNRLAEEEERALGIGEQLVTEVNNMISMASISLEIKTQVSIREIANTKIILYILVTVVPLLVAGLGYLFIRGFTEPVNILLDATRKLRDGNLDHRIHGLKDEFGEVAASFNDMSASLKDQMVKMQRTEQMVVLGELAAGLAHEIKNPLAGIKASVEALLGDKCISEEDRADILRAAEEIKRIEVLLKNLLNFAKPSKPQPIALDLNDFLDKTIVFSLKHPSIAANKSTTINVIRDFDGKLPETMADPMQLQQVFLNLILNAIDAMPNGGTLSVKTRYDRDAKTIHIDISDTGGGIDDAMADKIFQPFFTTKTKGTGLGLAISKRLIEQHGGRIYIENRPGIGVIFHVSIPVREEKRA